MHSDNEEQYPLVPDHDSFYGEEDEVNERLIVVNICSAFSNLLIGYFIYLYVILGDLDKQGQLPEFCQNVTRFLYYFSVALLFDGAVHFLWLVCILIIRCCHGRQFFKKYIDKQTKFLHYSLPAILFTLMILLLFMKTYRKVCIAIGSDLIVIFAFLWYSFLLIFSIDAIYD